jgi:hypothetical protein
LLILQSITFFIWSYPPQHPVAHLFPFHFMYFLFFIYLKSIKSVAIGRRRKQHLFEKWQYGVKVYPHNLEDQSIQFTSTFTTALSWYDFYDSIPKANKVIKAANIIWKAIHIELPLSFSLAWRNIFNQSFNSHVIKYVYLECVVRTIQPNFIYRVP